MTPLRPSQALRHHLEQASQHAGSAPDDCLPPLRLDEAEELLAEFDAVTARAEVAEHDLRVLRAAYRANGIAREALRRR